MCLTDKSSPSFVGLEKSHWQYSICCFGALICKAGPCDMHMKCVLQVLKTQAGFSFRLSDPIIDCKRETVGNFLNGGYEEVFFFVAK